MRERKRRRKREREGEGEGEEVRQASRVTVGATVGE